MKLFSFQKTIKQKFDWLGMSLLFSINQEPKSKNISIDEARIFRKALSDKAQAKYTEKLCVFFSFYSTKKNSPQVHNLVKNYMDLMHKPMENVDNLSKIVFDDDSQVSYLHAIHYYSEDTASGKHPEKPQIHINVVPFRYFRKMLNEVYNKCERPPKDDFFHEDSNFAETINSLVGKPGFENIDQTTVEDAQKMDHLINQESWLNFFDISIFDIAPIWMASRNRNYACFEGLFHHTLKIMSINIPKIPVKKGDSVAFEQDLKNELKKFKISVKTMNALQIPVAPKFLYFPPNGKHTKDIDNIVLQTIPKIIDILHPPQKWQKDFDDKESLRGINQYEILKMPYNKHYKDGSLFITLTNNLSFKSFWDEGYELLEKEKRYHY